jgi:hypothetical protein
MRLNTCRQADRTTLKESADIIVSRLGQGVGKVIHRHHFSCQEESSPSL